MAKRLRRKLAGSGREADDGRGAGAKSLPFEDSSFDTAVFTLVLCTVPDPAASLAEAARVLRPGGKLLFVEHVRAEDPGLARWQDRLERPWRFLADGCHCNRDTVATIEASPLTLDEVDSGGAAQGAAARQAPGAGQRCRLSAQPTPPADPTHDNGGYVNPRSVDLAEGGLDLAPQSPGSPIGSPGLRPLARPARRRTACR